LLKKIRGEHISYGPFKLGRYGIPTNVLALTYLIFVVIWMPFPTMLPVTKDNMNYAGPLMGAIIVLALSDWVISGRKRFRVPVMPNI
jgi:choline transport protein